MVDDGVVRVDIDTEPLARAMEKGPQTVYFWLQSWLFRSLKEHRVRWLKTRTTKFGRGKDGIKVWQINKAPSGQTDPKWVVYRTQPGAKKQPNRRAAEKALQKLGAEIFAGSVVLEVHQFGRDINLGSEWLAIPVHKVTKNNPRSPAKWRRKNPSKQLVTIPDPRRPDVLYLAEPKRYRGKRQRGRRARNRRKKVVRTKLVWRFLLVHRVQMEPTLNFYESWDRLASARQTDFAGITTRILQDIARGKLT